MNIVRRLDPACFTPAPKSIAIGYFDGIHLGHQAVLNAAISSARKIGGEAWTLTFDPHPLKVIHPEKAPRLLTSMRHKELLLRRLGIDGCALLDFSREMQHTSPSDFVAWLARGIPGIQNIVVGENWTFGYRQEGRLQTLMEHAAQWNITVQGVAPVLLDGAPVSSTRTREAVRRGDLEAVRQLLGRPFSLYGRVVRGRQVGRELGFPTANIDPQNEVHLPDGIYAARVEVNGQLHPAAAYIGKRPTFGTLGWVIEAHLMDGPIELYDADAEVHFIQKIRDDRAFANVEELKAQMHKDLDDIRSCLNQSAQTCSGSTGSPAQTKQRASASQ